MLIPVVIVSWNYTIFEAFNRYTTLELLSVHPPRPYGLQNDPPPPGDEHLRAGKLMTHAATGVVENLSRIFRLRCQGQQMMPEPSMITVAPIMVSSWLQPAGSVLQDSRL